MAQSVTEQRDRRQMLASLHTWLDHSEIRMRSDRLVGLPEDLFSQSDRSSESSNRMDGQSSLGFDADRGLLERLIVEQNEFDLQMDARQRQRDLIIEHARKRLEGQLVASVAKKPKTLRGSRLRPSVRGGSVGRCPGLRRQPHDETLPVKHEEFVSQNVNDMCDKWDRVKLATKARRTVLEERLAHANEVERLKNFDFDVWRRNYLAFMSSRKARLIDIFHKHDHDRDGKLTRAEFIDALLQSSEFTLICKCKLHDWINSCPDMTTEFFF